MRGLVFIVFAICQVQSESGVYEGAGNARFPALVSRARELLDEIPLLDFVRSGT